MTARAARPLVTKAACSAQVVTLLALISCSAGPPTAPSVASVAIQGGNTAMQVGRSRANSVDLQVLAAGGPAGPDGTDNGEKYPCTGTGAFEPAVLCVLAGAAPGGDGSAAAPFGSINGAIAAANAGDVIQVAGGTYQENVVLGGFGDFSDRHLTLLGGFDPTDFGARDASVTISLIDGGFQNPGVRLHVWSAHDTVLDGFQITHGRGLGSDWQDGFGAGGGVYVEFMGSGQVVVSHNVIFDNESTDYASMDLETRGGGIHVDYQDWGEDATGDVLLLGNVVRGNRASRGAGINVRGAQATIIGNLIEDNEGHGDHGGGLYISTGSTTVEANIVRGNAIGVSAGYGWGGGVIVSAADAQFRGNVITDNHAPSIGSGIFFDEAATGTMRNDLIVANRCPDRGSGAAIYVDGGAGPSHATVINATIADHDCPGSTAGAIYAQDGSTVTIRDSILWGNTLEFTDVEDGSHAISYSITAEAGTDNVLADPLFADATSGDYHLRSTAGRFTEDGWVKDALTSPAIDAGDPRSDYAAETEPNGGRVNMGVHGNTEEASRSP